MHDFAVVEREIGEMWAVLRWISVVNCSCYVRSRVYVCLQENRIENRRSLYKGGVYRRSTIFGWSYDTPRPYRKGGNCIRLSARSVSLRGIGAHRGIRSRSANASSPFSLESMPATNPIRNILLTSGNHLGSLIELNFAMRKCVFSTTPSEFADDSNIRKSSGLT